MSAIQQNGKPSGLLVVMALAGILLLFSTLSVWLSFSNVIAVFREFSFPAALYALVLMPFVLIALCLSVVILGWQKRKAVIVPTVALATSSTWPFMIEKFAPPGLMSGATKWYGDGITWMWMVAFGASAIYLVHLTAKGKLS
ncbi:MAG: hypothetical protein AAFY90_11540 [Pseudomonadota bacterium]